eukprot:8275585-Alexandrium_andersonii.AAC.1
MRHPVPGPDALCARRIRHGAPRGSASLEAGSGSDTGGDSPSTEHPAPGPEAPRARPAGYGTPWGAASLESGAPSDGGTSPFVERPVH